MVVDFSKELYGMDDEQLKLVASRVRDGDLSEVLRIYEKELKVSRGRACALCSFLC
jgi:nuclear-control-of-ATPase protein 2